MERYLIHVRLESLLQYTFPLLCLMRLVQWGAGHNQCPGRNPAHLEVSKISATLFRDYNITQIAPNQDWTCESWLVALPKN